MKHGREKRASWGMLGRSCAAQTTRNRVQEGQDAAGEGDGLLSRAMPEFGFLFFVLFFQDGVFLCNLAVLEFSEIHPPLSPKYWH